MLNQLVLVAMLLTQEIMEMGVAMVTETEVRGEMVVVMEEEEEGVSYPSSLRPGSTLGRPRGLSETIEFVVTPPPRTPTEERRDVRRTWGAAYHRP